jgi:hypothetical protein
MEQGGTLFISGTMELQGGGIKKFHKESVRRLWCKRFIDISRGEWPVLMITESGLNAIRRNWWQKTKPRHD